MLLADLGAEVIKVEPPETATPMRQWPPISEGYSENFRLDQSQQALGQGRADLKDPARRRRHANSSCRPMSCWRTIGRA